jgi:hypothetical protein
MLVFQAMHGLPLAQTEFRLANRLRGMRFCGLGPGDAVPDANTLWDFREAVIAARALDALFAKLDRAITEAGYLPMASLPAPSCSRSLCPGCSQRTPPAPKTDGWNLGPGHLIPVTNLSERLNGEVKRRTGEASIFSNEAARSQIGPSDRRRAVRVQQRPRAL